VEQPTNHDRQTALCVSYLLNVFNGQKIYLNSRNKFSLPVLPQKSLITISSMFNEELQIMRMGEMTQSRRSLKMSSCCTLAFAK